LSQMGSGSLTFVVRTSTPAATLTTPVMEAIWAANPGQSIWGAETVESMLAGWLKERRFNLLLLTSFSVLALVLAAVGIYGLISFSVERRVGELGIRRALGGRPSDLIAMVLREGAGLAAVGVVVGLGAALFLSRFMQGMLFQVEPTDPLTYVLLAALVLAVATVATLVPALRAIRVDPVVALRSE
ncbi:MAG: FtsX-like permease family protein, partial [Thermoanaerobaculia bacterium]|nr:FtsX-like permease family protein [Thermoanaerobaculia bacterium]